MERSAKIINLSSADGNDYAPSSDFAVGYSHPVERVTMSASAKDALHRIKDELDLKNDVELAEVFGIQVRRLLNWKHRKQMPTEQIAAVCCEHGLDLTYVLTGERSASPSQQCFADDVIARKQTVQGSEMCDPTLPRSSYVSCPCGQARICPPYKTYVRRDGAGNIIEQYESPQIVDVLSPGTNWLTHSLGVEPHNLLLIKNIGENMSPWLQDGDLVMIDTSLKNAVNGGCVVLRYADGLMIVRRVFRNPDGTFLAKCDSECCPPDIVDPHNNVVYPIIVGRVIRRLVR